MQGLLAEKLVYSLGMTEDSVEDPGESQAKNCASEEHGMDGDILPHPVHIATAQSVGGDKHKGQHSCKDMRKTAVQERHTGCKMSKLYTIALNC